MEKISGSLILFIMPLLVCAQDETVSVLTPIQAPVPSVESRFITQLLPSVSWDGRLGFKGSYNQLVVVRPEFFNDSGLPKDNIINGVFYSAPVPLPDFTNNNDTFLNVPGPNSTTTNRHSPFHLTLVKPPDVLLLPQTPGTIRKNPYSSDSNGNFAANGVFETYDAFVYGVDNGSNSFPEYVSKGLIRARLRIVVSAPKTKSAAIAKIHIVQEMQYMTDDRGNFYRGYEPNLTADGRLLFFHSTIIPTSISGYGRASGGGHVVYTYNENPIAVTGWKQARNFPEMYFVDRNRLVAGTVFHERYPIAKQQLVANDGQLYSSTDEYVGTYPWISFDGSELFHGATNAGFFHCDPDSTTKSLNPMTGTLQYPGSTQLCIEGIFSSHWSAYWLANKTY